MKADEPQPNAIVIPGIDRIAGSVTVDYGGDDDVCRLLLEGGMFRDLLAQVVAGAESLVPQGVTWRIHVTGDIQQSVSDLDSSYESIPYTIERGVSAVAGKTILQDDGSFDVLLSSMVMYPGDADTMGQALEDMALRTHHTMSHEALHVALHARGEDTFSVMPSVDHLAPHEHIWSRHLGFMLEDYRIEVALTETSPTNGSWVSSIGQDLALFESERARSQAVGVGQGDVAEGLSIMLSATVNLTRSLAYLASETSDPTGSLSGETLARWSRFVAPTWKLWVGAYGEAAAATVPMAAHDVAGVIEGLSGLGPVFMRSTGFQHQIDENGESAWWLHGFDW